MTGPIPPRHRGGFCQDEKKLPRGPNGRALCRECGQEVPKGRRTFCGQPCVDRWLLRSSPAAARAAVLKRDRGICAGCGLDCERADRRSARFRQYRYHYGDIRRERAKRGLEALARRHRQAVAYAIRRGNTSWHADHIVPVAKGGGCCTLDNLRTLCLDCHARETGALRRELNAERKKKEAR